MDQIDSPKARFALRLHELCADKQLSVRGRATQLALLFAVSQQGAAKWLGGISYPELETAIAIAEWAEVNVVWLLQGRGPKRWAAASTRAQLLDEAIRSLPPEAGIDLLDNLRAKLDRAARLAAKDAPARFQSMLDAYERDLAANRH